MFLTLKVHCRLLLVSGGYINPGTHTPNGDFPTFRGNESNPFCRFCMSRESALSDLFPEPLSFKRPQAAKHAHNASCNANVNLTQPEEQINHVARCVCVRFQPSQSPSSPFVFRDRAVPQPTVKMLNL